ncbi:Lrp/AsnC family transcriptional regulator, partial [Schaalia hyovaginalis]
MEASNPHNDRLADLGAANRAKLVSELRKGASLPLHLLSEATGLSRPTLKSHLDALVTAGI